MILLCAFALVSVLLAAVGIYGVISWGVVQRTREMGLRMALGAQSGDVLWLVLRRSMLLVLAGVSVGLIGAGFHARSVQIPCLDLSPQLRLTAIATSREQTAREAAQRYRVNAFANYKELLEKADVEAVIVATPTDVFDEVCKAALERGKHVLVESPGIGTLAGARELQALAEKKKLTAQVREVFASA